MWNGFIMVLFGGRLVPLTLIPTYAFAIFTVWAVIIWLLMPGFLIFGVHRGLVHALMPAAWSTFERLRATAEMFALGFIFSFLTAAITALWVVICL